MCSECRNTKYLLLAISSLLCFLLSAGPISAEFKSTAADSPLNGKKILSIKVVIKNVFENPQATLLFRTANSIKRATQEDVVKRELLFKIGDKYKEVKIRESARQLRALKYLRNINIETIPNGDGIDIIVHVQDTWTLIPQIGFSSGAGNNSQSVGIVESNLLGLGKRLEFSYEQDENREILSSIYEDPRLFGSNYRLLAAALQRSDGHQGIFYFGKPIRNLFTKTSWFINTDSADTIGLLWNDATEDYIFRQRNNDLSFRFTNAFGNAETDIERFSYGFSLIQNSYRQASAKDYNDMNLSPENVSNDPQRLPRDRRYYGPVLTYEYIEPDYISKNFVDRFDRVEDYNLGRDYDISLMIAPEAFGSFDDNLLASANESEGIKFSSNDFIRGEIGVSSRLNSDGLGNSMIRGEAKYYNVLGSLYANDCLLGRHTLAASYAVDYGNNLDRDRQLLAGGDSGLRGYSARAFSGDKKSLLNLEDRIHIMDNLFQLVSLGAVLFFDAGGATYNDFGSLFANNLYADVGIGLRLFFPRSSGGQVVRIDLGIPLRQYDEDSARFELRLTFAGGQAFSSKLRSESMGPEKSNVSIGLER